MTLTGPPFARAADEMRHRIQVAIKEKFGNIWAKENPMKSREERLEKALEEIVELPVYDHSSTAGAMHEIAVKALQPTLQEQAQEALANSACINDARRTVVLPEYCWEKAKEVLERVAKGE